MEIHQLRYFVAVAEAGSFSRAAERCRVAQPSLSQQIKKLETTLGQVLFDRLPHGAALTDAGHALLPRARRILGEVREARGEIERDLADGRLPLAVGAIPTMAPYLLPPVLQRLMAESPRCDLTVREDLTDRLIEAILDLEIDCAIMSTPIDHRSVELEVLGSERLLLAISRSTTLPSLSEIQLEMLREHPWILLHEMHCLGEQIRDFCEASELGRQIVCRSTQIDTVQRLVKLGLGYSLIPEMAARSDDSDTLDYSPMPEREPRREIAVVWRKDRSRSRLARRFVELIREDLEVGRHRLEDA